MGKLMSPIYIEGTNLSWTWAELLLQVHNNPGTEIAPLLLSLRDFVHGGVPREDPDLREALDELLEKEGKHSIDKVAFTIFPQRYWHLAKSDREALFHKYEIALPRLKGMNRKLNSRGMYFERMTMYGRGPCNGNQLQWILSQFNSNPSARRSKYQATILDPEKDHKPDAQLGFPCLQQVSFVPTENGLVVNAFYPTQQIFDKAYGNYLGLAHLGAFMAHEMDTFLAQLNVTVGVAKLERIAKSDPGLANVIEIAECLVGSS